MTILVPAKNEAAAIGRTLDSLPLGSLHELGLKTEVVVLDGDSTDDTRRIAARHGARVLRDPGTGKGRAFRLGRRRLLGAWVVMLDADGSYATDTIPELVRLLRAGEADVVMGDRRPRDGAMNAVHRFGNAMLSLEAKILYGRDCPDVCTGLWGFRADVLRSMPLQAKGFELEAELFAVASRMGLRVGHVPVDYFPREGETKLSAGRDGLRIGWCLIHRRFASLEAPVEEPVTDRAGRPVAVPVEEGEP